MTAQKQVTLSVSSLALFLFLGARVWATEIPAPDYRSRVQDYVELLEQKEGKLHSEESRWFNSRFPPHLVVRDVAGESYLIDREDFLHWLQAAEVSPEGRDELIAYQDTLLKQISREAGRRFQEKANWQKCRALLDQIYTGKGFSKLVKKTTPPWRKFLREFLAAMAKWLGEHVKFLCGIKGKWLFFASYLTLLVLASTLIIWIIRLLGPVGWRWPQPRVALPAPSQSSTKKSWREWRDEANKKAQQGAFREAIRFLFISVLLEGQQKGWWVYEPEATNREHLAQVETTSTKREPLQKLIESYELAWYGLRQPGRQEFQECEQLAQRMEV